MATQIKYSNVRNSPDSTISSEFVFVNDPLSDLSEDKESEKGEEKVREYLFRPQLL